MPILLVRAKSFQTDEAAKESGGLRDGPPHPAFMFRATEVYNFSSSESGDSCFEGDVMQAFVAGDDLVFQLESGFGLLRVLLVERRGEATVWHLLAYEELFPDVETAEAALGQPASLHPRIRHMALTDRAFERTPAAKLGNRPVTEGELSGYREWLERGEGQVSDRSALLMLGLR